MKPISLAAVLVVLAGCATSDIIGNRDLIGAAPGALMIVCDDPAVDCGDRVRLAGSLLDYVINGTQSTGAQ